MPMIARYMAAQKESERLISFMMDREEYSFPVESVQEVVRLPEVLTGIPGAPGAVSGIINLRGNILPLIDLRERLALGPSKHSADTRVIVVRHAGSVTGMIVDKVNEILRVEKHAVNDPPSGLDSRLRALLRGLAHLDEGERVVMILSGEKLLPEARPDPTRELPSLHNIMPAQPRETVRDEERYLVSFHLGDEHYALSISDVSEVVRIGEIVEMPQSPAYIPGYMALHSSLIPVVDLRLRFGATAEKAATLSSPNRDGWLDDEIDPRRVIVLSSADITFGLLADRVSRVLRVPEKNIMAAPGMLDSSREQYIQEIARLDGDRRLLLLLTPSRLFSGEERKAVQTPAEESEGIPGTTGSTAEAESGTERQVVCFGIEDEEYGVDIDQVREISYFGSVTVVPNAPAYVCGIVNLRGDVLPVIDLRLLFGHERRNAEEQKCVIVLEHDGTRTGLLVDEVSEVVSIPEHVIEPAPVSLSSGTMGDFADGIAVLDTGERTITLLDIGRVLLHASGKELSESAAAGTGGSGAGPALKKQEIAEGIPERAPGMVAPAHRSISTGGGRTQNVAVAFAQTHHGQNDRMQQLLNLKKKVLLALAQEAGLQPRSRATKKQIASLIVEKEMESR